jgi:hypothetical protein
MREREMELIAQTNIQLYNQLRRQGREEAGLLHVRRAYEHAVTLYTGCFGADRKPFVAHSVGVASILAHLDLPAEYVAAGVLHNIYGNGNFGDGRHNSATDRRRHVVRQAVGDSIEALVYRFHRRRVRLDPGEGYRQRLDRLAEVDPLVLLLDLADVVEKHVDGSVLYHGDGEWITTPVAQHGPHLIELASRVGQPRLARMLEDGFATVARDPGLPAALRAPRDRKHLTLVVPRSCRRRWIPLVAKGMRWLAQPRGWARTLRRLRQRFAVSA